MWFFLSNVVRNDPLNSFGIVWEGGEWGVACTTCRSCPIERAHGPSYRIPQAWSWFCKRLSLEDAISRASLVGIHHGVPVHSFHMGSGNLRAATINTRRQNMAKRAHGCIGLERPSRGLSSMWLRRAERRLEEKTE